MLRFAGIIDGLNGGIGRVAAWLMLAMVLVQFSIVLARHVFGLGWIWAQESVTYMHAGLFMLAAAWTLRNDRHVRVDIFYSRASAHGRALVDLLGAALLVLPVCALILWVSLPYVSRSWAVLEGSRETSGLPFVFALKTLILVFAVQMGLQGVSMALRAAGRLRAERAGR